MFEPHHQRYLERIWQTQESDVNKRQEPWFYLVLGFCAVCMIFQPIPTWKLAEMCRIISIVYVLLTTISTGIIWTMASPARVQKWTLEQVFDKGMVEMALDSGWKDFFRYAVIVGVAVGLWIMGSIWASALALIWLTMKFELKHRWKMFMVHKLPEIPQR